MREHSGEFLYLRWVWADEGIDPYEFFRGFRKNRGIVTGGNPRRGPRQSELHYGITATGSYYNFDSLRGAPLARNDSVFGQN